MKRTPLKSMAEPQGYGMKIETERDKNGTVIKYEYNVQIPHDPVGNWGCAGIIAAIALLIWVCHIAGC